MDMDSLLSPEQPINRGVENLQKPSIETPSGIQSGMVGAPEPPLAPRMTRLYRAEDASGPSLEDMGFPVPISVSENRGRWFTASRESADRFLKTIAEDGTEKRSNTKLFYVDVPTADAERFRVSNFPKEHSARNRSGDPEREFVLPKEEADRKQAMPVATKTAPPPRLPVTEPHA